MSSLKASSNINFNHTPLAHTLHWYHKQDAPVRTRRVIRIRTMSLCVHCGLPRSEAVKVLKCSRCKTATYCSTKCQRENWKEHRQICVPPPEDHDWGTEIRCDKLFDDDRWETYHVPAHTHRHRVAQFPRSFPPSLSRMSDHNFAMMEAVRAPEWDTANVRCTRNPTVCYIAV